mmetsp:Transcript_22717/g.57940  ORF Transcript_22717/g.57940 Transcript_22717/m.57940 type:complete len:371 (-) Transcript_22717:405-1517(-)
MGLHRLRHGEHDVLRVRVHALDELLVVEVRVVALVAVVAAQQADLLLRQPEAERGEDSARLTSRHIAAVRLVEVGEDGLDQHALLPHDGAHLVLDGRDQVHLRGAQHVLVPPRRRRRGRVRHGDRHRGIPLQARRREGLVHVLAEGLVDEHAVVARVHADEHLEVRPVDVLAQVHDRQDRLHLAGGADALAQRVEVLELLPQAHPLLHDPGPELLQHGELAVAPLRVVRLQVERAGGEGRRRVVHHVRDVVVERDEVDVALLVVVLRADVVALAEDLDVLLRHLLFEGESADELHLRDLASPAGVLPRRRRDGRPVEVGVAGLDHHAARLAERGEAVQHMLEVLLRLLVLEGLGHEGAGHGAPGRGHPRH